MTHSQADMAAMFKRGRALAERSLGPVLKTKGSLVEAQGWKEMVESIANPERQSFVANMLENYRIARSKMDESTTSLSVGSFDKYAFPLISIVSENMIGQELVSVQPIEGPSGHIFFVNLVTGQSKGNVPKGTPIWDARSGRADRMDTSDDAINEEHLGDTDGSGDLSSVNLSYTPIVPGTLTVQTDDGATVYRDNGNGLVLSGASTVGSVDYNTGAVVLTGAEVSATFTASYNTNSELNGEAQMLDIEIAHAPVFAKERKMRIRWSTEAAQVLDALHSINAESLLTSAVTNNINWEIDREIIEDLRRAASAGTVNWSATPPSGQTIGYQEHKLSFVDAVVYASGYISRATNRVRANWLVAGQNGSNVIETLPQFEPSDADLTEIEGVCYLGNLGRLKVYSDPHYIPNECLVGYKGKDFTRAGYVYAPWLLLFSTPTITLDDFINRKGMASSYAKKVINSRFYSKIKLSNFSDQFGEP